MDRNLKIMLWNARSILANLGEFQRSLDENNPHLVCMTETWLNPNKNLKFKAFNVIRMDRPTQTGGGAAILIRKEIEYNNISFNPFNGGKLEYAGIKLKLGGGGRSLTFFYSTIPGVPFHRES